MKKLSKVVTETYTIKHASLEDIFNVLRPYWGKTLVRFSVKEDILELERVE